MRSSPLVLVALSQLVSAEWFVGQQLERYPGNDPLPRMTAASSPDGVNGWSPKPTEAPLVEGDESDSWDLLRRRSDQFVKMKRQSANTWTNQKTCGWFSRSLAEPFVCTASETCTTNSDRVVACQTDGETTGFFTMCFDYDAYTKGACSGMGPKTGCCWTSSIGACITYIWAGATARSMYRCHTSPTIVTMLDVPRSALQATISTSSSSMIITSTSSTASSSSVTSSTSSSTNTGTNSPDPDGGDNKKKSNAGAIAGGVVGGVAGAAILAGAIIFILIKRRGPKQSSSVNPSYSAVANPGDTSYGGGNPQQQQQQFSPGYPQNMISPQMSSAAYFPQSTTLASSTPYSNSTPPPGNNMTDPRYSYYDASKFPEHQQQQQQYPGSNSPPPVSQYGGYPNTTPSPHNAGVVGGPYPAPGLQQGQYPPMPGQYQAYGQQPQQQPHHFASELDNTATVLQGQQGNPVEMDVNSPVQMSQPQQQPQQQQYQQQHQQQQQQQQ